MASEVKMCLLCRGAKGLCGRPYCPVIAKNAALIKVGRVIGKRELFGSSPPSVFVGRYGYPEVFAGPSTPPVTGDTSVYDLPERWLGLPLERVLDYRLSMVTARGRVRVDRPERSRLVRELHELVLSVKPVDVEVRLRRPPKPALKLSDYEAPQGPTAPLEEFKVVGGGGSAKVVEYVYGDVDLRALDAILRLYEGRIPVTHIQRMLSVGALGRGRSRRLVPTRWAITAVDDTISKHLIRGIKRAPLVNEYRVYARRYAKNLFVAVLIPGPWSFEWMEAWYPNSTWNPGGRVVVEGDWEGPLGRSTYASIGGCYYAARLATSEHLASLGRQATAVVLREIYPGFNIPIGVWFVRENLRAMYKEGPILKTDSWGEVLDSLERVTDLGAGRWLASSKLLAGSGHVSITDYLEGAGVEG